MAPNEIYQYSVISALMDGIADKGLLVSDLVSRGNHGLGTFRHMVGEMVVVDGEVYQMKSDGTVSHIDSRAAGETIAPFAMVTRFEPTVRTTAPIASKQALSSLLSQLLPGTKNHFLAFRMEGIFKSITVRTAAGQTVPRQSLTEVGKHQVSHTFSDSRGTVIGFRSPAFLQGVSVAGDHLHFITDDRRHGGHVLAIETDGDVDMSAAQIWKFEVELPSGDDEFNQAKLEADVEGIAAVEG